MNVLRIAREEWRPFVLLAAILFARPLSPNMALCLGAATLSSVEDGGKLTANIGSAISGNTTKSFSNGSGRRRNGVDNNNNYNDTASNSDNQAAGAAALALSSVSSTDLPSAPPFSNPITNTTTTSAAYEAVNRNGNKSTKSNGSPSPSVPPQVVVSAEEASSVGSGGFSSPFLQGRDLEEPGERPAVVSDNFEVEDEGGFYFYTPAMNIDNLDEGEDDDHSNSLVIEGEEEEDQNHEGEGEEGDEIEDELGKLWVGSPMGVVGPQRANATLNLAGTTTETEATAAKSQAVGELQHAMGSSGITTSAATAAVSTTTPSASTASTIVGAPATRESAGKPQGRVAAFDTKNTTGKRAPQQSPAPAAESRPTKPTATSQPTQASPPQSRTPQPYCIGHYEIGATFNWACQGILMLKVPSVLQPKPTSLYLWGRSLLMSQPLYSDESLCLANARLNFYIADVGRPPASASSCPLPGKPRAATTKLAALALLLRLSTTGLETVPRNALEAYRETLRDFDLDNNKIATLGPKPLNIRAEILNLEFNHLTSIEEHTFNNSEIGALLLSGNVQLTHIHKNAFANLKNLIKLDLSSTSVAQLPTVGLHQLRLLRIRDNYALRQIPSIYVFPALEEAHLTYAYHCCSFKYPQTHDPSAYEQHNRLQQEIDAVCSRRASEAAAAAAAATTLATGGSGGRTEPPSSPSSTTMGSSVTTDQRRQRRQTLEGWSYFSSSEDALAASADHLQRTHQEDQPTLSTATQSSDFEGFFEVEMPSERNQSAAGSRVPSLNSGGSATSGAPKEHHQILMTTTVTTSSTMTGNLPGQQVVRQHKAAATNNLHQHHYMPPQTSLNKQWLLQNIECGELVQARGSNLTISCTPEPDAFNPCEDIMGYSVLRWAVWLVVGCSVLGNMSVIVVLTGIFRRLSVPKFLQLNLAIGDLFMGVYLAMLAGADLSTAGAYFNYAIDWQHGLGCNLAGASSLFASQLSIFTLSVITFERYYTITYSIDLRMRLQLGWAARIMFLGWCYAFASAMLPIFANINSYSKTSICLPMRTNYRADRLFISVLLIVDSLAFFIIFVCYLRMYLLILRQKTDATLKERTVAMRMALLVFTDFACWAPIIFFGATAIFGRPLISVTNSKILIVFFYPLNSMANPFLYVISTRQYRRDLDYVASRWRHWRKNLFKKRDHLESSTKQHYYRPTNNLLHLQHQHHNHHNHNQHHNTANYHHHHHHLQHHYHHHHHLSASGLSAHLGAVAAVTGVANHLRHYKVPVMELDSRVMGPNRKHGHAHHHGGHHGGQRRFKLIRIRETRLSACNGSGAGGGGRGGDTPPGGQYIIRHQILADKCGGSTRAACLSSRNQFAPSAAAAIGGSPAALATTAANNHGHRKQAPFEALEAAAAPSNKQEQQAGKPKDKQQPFVGGESGDRQSQPLAAAARANSAQLAMVVEQTRGRDNAEMFASSLDNVCRNFAFKTNHGAGGGHSQRQHSPCAQHEASSASNLGPGGDNGEQLRGEQRAYCCCRVRDFRETRTRPATGVVGHTCVTRGCARERQANRAETSGSCASESGKGSTAVKKSQSILVAEDASNSLVSGPASSSALEPTSQLTATTATTTTTTPSSPTTEELQDNYGGNRLPVVCLETGGGGLSSGGSGEGRSQCAMDTATATETVMGRNQITVQFQIDRASSDEQPQVDEDGPQSELEGRQYNNSVCCRHQRRNHHHHHRRRRRHVHRHERDERRHRRSSRGAPDDCCRCATAVAAATEPNGQHTPRCACNKCADAHSPPPESNLQQLLTVTSCRVGHHNDHHRQHQSHLNHHHHHHHHHHRRRRRHCHGNRQTRRTPESCGQIDRRQALVRAPTAAGSSTAIGTGAVTPYREEDCSAGVLRQTSSLTLAPPTRREGRAHSSAGLEAVVSNGTRS